MQCVCTSGWFFCYLSWLLGGCTSISGDSGDPLTINKTFTCLSRRVWFKEHSLVIIIALYVFNHLWYAGLLSLQILPSIQKWKFVQKLLCWERGATHLPNPTPYDYITNSLHTWPPPSKSWLCVCRWNIFIINQLGIPVMTTGLSDWSASTKPTCHQHLWWLFCILAWFSCMECTLTKICIWLWLCTWQCLLFLQFVQMDQGSTSCNSGQKQSKAQLRSRNGFQKSSSALEHKERTHTNPTDGVRWKYHFGKRCKWTVNYLETNFDHISSLLTLYIIMHRRLQELHGKPLGSFALPEWVLQLQ